MLIPFSAWATINQDWQLEIPFIDLTYKPWRLFIVVCAIPGLVSAIALIFLPESPKFVLSQGDKVGAYQILQKINRWNNGKKSELEKFEIREEIEWIEKQQCMSDMEKGRFALLKSVWNQTAPLFKPPHLKPTILLCTIQFGTYLTSNGFFMFIGEILNRMSVNLDSFIDDRIMMCDAINMKSTNTNTFEFDDSEVCVDKLEISALANGLYLELIFAVGSAVAGLLINRLGKFLIICKYYSFCNSNSNTIFICFNHFDQFSYCLQRDCVELDASLRIFQCYKSFYSFGSCLARSHVMLLVLRPLIYTRPHSGNFLSLLRQH